MFIARVHSLKRKLIHECLFVCIPYSDGWKSALSAVYHQLQEGQVQEEDTAGEALFKALLEALLQAPQGRVSRPFSSCLFSPSQSQPRTGYHLTLELSLSTETIRAYNVRMLVLFSHPYRPKAKRAKLDTAAGSSAVTAAAAAAAAAASSSLALLSAVGR